MYAILINEAQALCAAVERMPASEQQTELALQASALLARIKESSRIDCDPPQLPGLEDATCSVVLELLQSVKKFPDWPTHPIHQAAEVADEAGELTRAALKVVHGRGDRAEMERVAIHTGATALRFIMAYRQEKR